MTIFHFVDDAERMKCLVNTKEQCLGTKCMAWMYKQENDSEGIKMTNTSKGVCGWLYAMAYFRDKNVNPNL